MTERKEGGLVAREEWRSAARLPRPRGCAAGGAAGRRGQRGLRGAEVAAAGRGARPSE
jgi:hypothetical protein